jgi:hypothetical protein
MARTMTDDQRFEYWNTWLGEIYQDVYELVIRCHIFWVGCLKVAV